MSRPTADTFPLDAHLAIQVDRLVSGRPMTGCAVGIMDRGWRPFVSSTDSTGATPISAEVWSDLASLTKVLVMLPSLLRLVEAGLVDLTCRSPGSGSGPAANRSERVHRRNSSHIHRVSPPMFRSTSSTSTPRTSLVEHVMSTELTAALGTSATYSEIGYILLGEFVAEVLSVGAARQTRAIPGLTFGPVTGAWPPRLRPARGERG